MSYWCIMQDEYVLYKINKTKEALYFLTKEVAMNKKEKDFIAKKLEKIAIEISCVKHLAIILEELIQNDAGNLSKSDVATLSVILTRTVAALENKFDNFGLKFGI